MEQLFDALGLFEAPQISLCNPNGEELYSLGTIYERKLELRYNGVSKFSFTAPFKVNSVEVEYYNLLSYRRMILIDGIGYFTISSVKESNDGIVRTKEVECNSIEAVLMDKKVSLFKGTFEFYDPVEPSNTLVGTILTYIPSWGVGYIDSSLWGLYRTFDVSDSTAYKFLMTDVEQAYQCVFTFDYENKLVSAYSTQRTATETDIFLSFDNLIKSVDVDIITEEIVTALNVYGEGDLDIRTVNPLGTATIYDFGNYQTTDWMSQGLIDAIDAWGLVISNNQQDYADTLAAMKTEMQVRLGYQEQLNTYKTQRVAIEGVIKVRIEQGLSYEDQTILLVAKNAQIKAKSAQITASTATINGYSAHLAEINALCSFETNFTEAQLQELDPFIIVSTYQNPNFIQTDEMTDYEIQDMAQELYDQAQGILGKMAIPRYEFSIDAANFILLKEFSTFTGQLELGSQVTLDLGDGSYVYPVLLGIDINYDDPESFSLTFGNRLRLDDSSYMLTDLFGENASATVSTSFNSSSWGNWTTTYKDSVSTFITSSLDTSVNNLISATNEEIIINQNGLMGRRYNETTGSYNDNQVWLTSDTMAFTRDNWNTASMAIGQIVTPTGGSAYGLVADVVVGRMVAGNELLITNENNKFIVDGNGATLEDATLRIVTSGSKNRILLDAENGIAVQKGTITGGSVAWDSKFKVDSSGNVIFAGTLNGANGTFSGTITANTGTIGGWTINSSGLYKNSNLYIYSDGNIRLGALTISGTTSTFNGTIYADKIIGQIVNAQIGSGAVTNTKLGTDIDASKVTTGTMSGNRVYGGTITWQGVNLYGVGGKLTAKTTDGFSVYTGDAKDYLALNITNPGNVNIRGRIYPSANTGLIAIDEVVRVYCYVDGAYATRDLFFTNGILVRVG